MYAGRIPVLETSLIDPLFTKLPVIIVPSLINTTLDALVRLHAEVMAGFDVPGRYSPRLLEVEYWECRVLTSAGRREGGCE